jgi:hypothetical protein
MMVAVPEDLVGMPADDGWAAWTGLTSWAAGDRTAVVLVSITVTALDAALGTARAADSLAARVRARYPEGSALIEEFTTPGGHRAVSLRRAITQAVGGRDVTTGQAQALVVYPGPGALGVVSAIALDPDDLDRAVALVTGIAAGMTVTSAPAAA